MPAAGIFHDDIEWMAANAITQCCNPPANTLYCPGDGVTSEQMPAFMRRLATSQAVDAGTVQGMTATDVEDLGVVEYERVSEWVVATPGVSYSVLVSCRDDMKVLSGGLQVSGALPGGSVISGSYPIEERKWRVSFAMDPAAEETEALVWAICATA